MDFPVIVDVVIGIVVVYFISSVCLSFILNYIMSRRNWKGEFLYDQLQNLFSSGSGSNAAFIERIYKHPLIDSLKQYNYRKPEKIDPDLFSQTVMAVIRDLDQEVLQLKEKELVVYNDESKLDAQQIDQINSIKEIIDFGKYRSIQFNNEYIDGQGIKLLSTILHSSNKNDKEGEEALKKWYTNFVDRTQYLFSRKTKWHLFYIAFIFSVCLNVDTLKIYKTLYREESTRAALVVMATDLQNLGEENATKKILEKFPSINKDSLIQGEGQDSFHLTINHIHKIQSGLTNAYGDANLLIWWKQYPWHTLKYLYASKTENVYYAVFLKLLGFLISSMALMYGAPFWYDFMKKMITLRQNITTK